MTIATGITDYFCKGQINSVILPSNLSFYEHSVWFRLLGSLSEMWAESGQEKTIF